MPFLSRMSAIYLWSRITALHFITVVLLNI